MRSGPAACALFGLLAATAEAHRLDEYLQASLISLTRNQVHVQLELTPGIAVLPVVLSKIDTDRDGVVSQAEWNAYAAQVLRDLSLSVDGDAVPLRLVSSRFPEMAEMREGLGAIRLEMTADLRPSWSAKRRLRFENHHQKQIAAYLANSLVPEDPALRITAQSRDFPQSVYLVDLVDSGRRPRLSSFSLMPAWIWAILLLLAARIAILWRRRRV